MGETYGEDPTLSAAMSVAFVKGLQSDDLGNGVAATGKHFLGYAMGEGGLNSASASISHRDLREVYAKPFQAAITEADLQTVMNSYGTIDNEPVIVSKAILTGLLREEMAFDGLTVSDYGSVSMMKGKRIAANDQACAVKALKAGMEMECPNPETYINLKQGLADGEISIELIDRAVAHVLEGKFRLGLFESPYPRTELVEAAYRDDRHAEHSLKVARESVVLLKNDGVLPLAKNLKKIAVIGPRADSVRMMYGGYTVAAGLEMTMGSMLSNHGIGQGGESDEYFPNSHVKRESVAVTQAVNSLFGSVTTTIFGAIQAKCPESEVCFELGCDIAGDDRSRFWRGN